MSQKYHLFDPTPEHRLLRQSLKEFVSKEVEPQALWHDQNEKFNLKLFKKLGPLGFLGLTVKDSELGGMDLDAAAVCLVHEELSYSDPVFCLAYLAHSVLCVHNLSQNANEEQKKKFLPKLCSGEWVGSMAMSEPDVGTDVLSMTTSAQKDGNSYQINGRKMWITNGVLNDEKQLTDGCLVYAKMKEQSNKISLFFVEKKFKGFEAGQNIKNKTGMRASNTAELVFNRCLVPASHRIGEEGEAIDCMMKNLEIERLALAAMSLGIARRALDEMNKYATQRQAFGQSIRKFGQIQRYLADSYAEFQACRVYVYHVAQQLDLNKGGQRLESDSAKLIASQVGKKVADHAIQVLGGYGYVGEYHVERFWRDAKLLEIGGGTIEALQKNISKELKGIHNV